MGVAEIHVPAVGAATSVPVTSTQPDNEALEFVPGLAGASEGPCRLAPAAVERGALPVADLVRTARPRQWVKNLLVFAAPGAAGVLADLGPFLRASGAFAVFCVAASGTYLVNDAFDVDADRLHPTKRRRPVAAGTVSVGLAELVGGTLLVASVGLALALAGWRLALVVAAYATLQPLYGLWLRKVPVVDLAVVASGFVLRAIAGGVAVGVPISGWFLIVTSFGSLFVVAGKRHAEHVNLGEDRSRHRSTLRCYSPAFLRPALAASSSVALAAYCLWAFEKAELAHYPLWFELSIIPLVVATLRYTVLLGAGRGGAPEDLVLEDRPLQVMALVWITTLAVGVHAG